MRFYALAAALLLTACGTLPQPFYGNPGGQGAKLSIPPAPVLIVPTPDNALLSREAAALYAGDLAGALASLDVPSIARPATTTDWRLIATASLDGGAVTLHYTLLGPDGKTYGRQDGGAVAAADWANGAPAALNAAATGDSIPISKMLAIANAQVQQSNPNSLENRPPRVFFNGVTGAPGDGDHALALNLTRDLPPLGPILVKTRSEADFTVTGIVIAKPDTDHQTLIQINWIIADSNNRNIGQVTQLHDLNLADISPYWGDVAAAAAAEAAGGINHAIYNDTLHRTAGS